jgi:hypothetical protein
MESASRLEFFPSENTGSQQETRELKQRPSRDRPHERNKSPDAGFLSAENDATKPGVYITMSFIQFKASPLETLFVPAVRTMAVAILATAAVAAHAQASSSSNDQAAPLPAASSFFAPSQMTPAATPQPLYSSSADQNAPDTEASLNPAGGVNFANYMQYGGGQRRRYGAPRYRGNNTNADGSPKWTGYAGVGLAQPVGNTWKYDTPSWAFQVGFGRQFSRHFAVPIEFAWDNFGLTKATLDNQFNLYNNQITYICNQDPAGCAANGLTTFSSLDGNAHVWSFSLQPTYTIYSGEGLGAYVLGGVGFFHKVTNFTTPEAEEYCDYYGFCGEYEANAVVDHYTSNAPGVDAGIGFTYKFSKFSNERLYAEARYVVIFNSQRTGVNINTPVNATTVNIADEYAPNSNRTTYFPIKFGIRF